MRLATFNLESLDLGAKAQVDLETRASVLRPALERLAADILCLQEVNGQHVAGQQERKLVALDRLLEGTRYESYSRAVTTRPDGHAIADVHNLVTLSRFPIVTQRQVLHDFVPPAKHASLTAGSAKGAHVEICFDRPMLLTQLSLPNGVHLSVINIHLRAPLASAVPGQKTGPFSWRTVGGWAEGFYLSTLKRAAQALELRLLVEQILKQDSAGLIAAAGDFNAVDYGPTLRLVVAPEEDVGSSELAPHALIVLDRSISADRRWSVLHHGREQMLDHILASRELYGHFRSVEVHNESLGDEALGYGKAIHSAASYHAPLVAEFDFGAQSASDRA